MDATIGASTGDRALANAWVLSSPVVDRAGRAVSNAQLHELLLRACPTLAEGLPRYTGAGAAKVPGGLAGAAFPSCTNALARQLQLLVVYQPSSHYWPLQGLETGIFLAAALALLGATVWLIGRAATRPPAAAAAGGRASRSTLLRLAA
ncbi:MAG TPA: hypothetical protein VKU89_11780 [Solirubrobacteraceae bacterium]|nr:hypothetical protein [Solirubrobacteraceae bacterium]